MIELDQAATLGDIDKLRDQVLEEIKVLHCRLDEKEEELKRLKAKVRKLAHSGRK